MNVVVLFSRRADIPLVRIVGAMHTRIMIINHVLIAVVMLIKRMTINYILFIA